MTAGSPGRRKWPCILTESLRSRKTLTGCPGTVTATAWTVIRAAPWRPGRTDDHGRAAGVQQGGDGRRALVTRVAPEHGRGRFDASQQPLRTGLHVIAKSPHNLDGLADICLILCDVHGRCDRNELGVELAVARVAFAGKPYKLRALVLRIVDEFHQPLGRELIGQPLHALTARRSHPGDPRHGERT